MVCEARAYTPSAGKMGQGQGVKEGFGVNTATYHSAHVYTNNSVYLQWLEKARQELFYFAGSYLHVYQSY